MKHATKILAALLLVLAMVVGLMPGMSLTAYAGTGDKFVVTITGNGNQLPAVVESSRRFSCKEDTFGDLDMYILQLYNLNFEAERKCVATAPTVSEGNGAVTAGLEGDYQYIQINQRFEGIVTVSGKYNDGTKDFDYSLSLSCSDYTPATGVSLSPNTNKTIGVGEIVAFTASVTPDTASQQMAKVNVSNDCVKVYSDEECRGRFENGATVPANGRFNFYAKGEAVGTATVTVTCIDDENKTASCNITVNASVEYPLWVGGKRVTSANAGNIDGNNKASYDHQTKTLTLNNYSYSGAGSDAGRSGSDAAITTSEDLNIVITGTNSVKCTSLSGIYVSGNLTISGTGSLTAEGKDVGIYNDENGSVKISSGTMTAIGESYAIYGSLRNDIAGTGWTDTAGTQGKAGIAISDTGRYFTNYKKIQFPAVPDSSMVATAPTGKSLSHNAQPQPLVNPGTASGGTMEYALGKDDVTAPVDGWSTAIPSGTEPGKYYVWYRVVGDENHNDVAPACIVVTIEEPTSQETPAAAPATPESLSDYTLLASMKTSGNKAFKLKWTAVSGAEGYDVFLGDCGGGECELKKTVTGLSCKIGKLKKGNAYKAFVKAWKTENGQKVYIGEASPDVHAVAGGKSNKYTNAKKITVKKKKLTVAVGGSKKIKASLKKFSNSRRYLNHTAKIRYFSSNRAVATVNAKGKVTGVAPGTCTVYAVAENGLRKGVKITVK